MGRRNLRPLGNPLNNPVAAKTLPAYIYFHGAALSAWFLLLLSQTLLVANRNVRTHRLLGKAGAVLALVVFGLSTFVTVKSAGRLTGLGAPIDQISLIVIGDLAILLLFAGLVGLALAWRRKPDYHKRFMIIGSIGLLAPALARWPGAESFIPLSVIIPQLALMSAVAVHDRVTLRRFHPATLWGIAAYVVLIGGAVPFSFTAAGMAFVNALR